MRSSSWLLSGKEARNNHQNRCNDEDGDGGDDDGDGDDDDGGGDDMVKYCTFQQVMKILKTINPAVQDDVDNDLVMSRGSSNPDFAAWVPIEFSLGAPSY